MSGRMIAVTFVAVVAVVGLAVLSTWRLASAWGPDVNGDGTVTMTDILTTVHAYAQAVPTQVQVVEQNLDGNGNMKVHEQGIADVNVLSLPSGPATEHLYTFAQNVPGSGFQSTVLDVDGCREFDLMADFEANADAFVITVFQTTDGVNRYPVTSISGTGFNNQLLTGSFSSIAGSIVIGVSGTGSQMLQEGVLHCVSA